MEFVRCDRQGLDTTAWEHLAHAGSVFHLLAWIDLCVEAFAPRAESFFLCGYDQGKLCAGMPAVTRRRLVWRTVDALPLGTYGGPIFLPGIAEPVRRDFIASLQTHCADLGAARLAIVDFDHALDSWNAPGFKRQQAMTHLVTLPAEGEFLAPDKKVAQHVRSGQKFSGCIIEIQTAEQVGLFYDIYSATERRHGRSQPIIKRRFFDCLLDRFGGSRHLYWVAAEIDGAMAASQINLVWEDTLFNWQVVSDLKFRQSKPTYLLHDAMISYAQEHGLRKINLGASPPEAEGLIDYKERWGGVRVEYEMLTASSMLWRIWERWRR